MKLRLLFATWVAFAGISGVCAREVRASESISAKEGEVISTGDEVAKTFDIEYFAIFYGPSLQNPSGYQPKPFGGKDLSHPVVLRNFLGVGYNITDEIAVTPTASWLWNPIGRQTLTLQDPYLRVSDSSVFSTEQLNLYSDIRFYFPATRLSQDARMILGIQTFQALSYDIGRTPMALGLYASARYNLFGDQSYGNDLELYLAPNFLYQFASTASFVLTYEMNAVHILGTKPGTLENTGTALQPGVAWAITPKLMFNPYLSLSTGGSVNFKTTQLGFSISYRMI